MKYENVGRENVMPKLLWNNQVLDRLISSSRFIHNSKDELEKLNKVTNTRKSPAVRQCGNTGQQRDSLLLAMQRDKRSIIAPFLQYYRETSFIRSVVLHPFLRLRYLDMRAVKGISSCLNTTLRDSFRGCSGLEWGFETSPYR